ncbi:MAG: DEAD/DEAH box helicase [Candidatus Sericytochromatia bacterium]|nr:DEAD/DEAH box helicase [Candidatus Sericytochromatia bacterium]
MTVLHASVGPDDIWLLWGEKPGHQSAARSKSRLVAASQAEILSALDAAGVLTEPDPEDPPHAPLWLPVVRGGGLVSSSENPELGAPCQGYLLPCLKFRCRDLLDLLRLLPTIPPAGVSYGDSLAWLRPFFALALDMIAKGQLIATFLPSVSPGEPDRSVWMPILEAPDVITRLQALAATAPGVITAGVPDDATMPAADRLLAACVDDLARHFLDDADWPGPSWQRPPGAAASWLASLGSLEATLRLTSPQRRTLQSALAAWLSPLSGTVAHDLVLVLQEPPGDGDWQLTYWLQSGRDASLLLPAAAVWHDGEDWVAELGLQAARPGLLSQLGTAASVYAPVRRSLQDLAPAGCGLSLPEVVDLLWRAMPLLQEQGITVRVPDWCRRPTRPRVAVCLAPQESAGMGLSAIASFALEAALGDCKVDLAEIRALAAAKQSLVQVGGRWMAVDPGDLDRLATFMAQRGAAGTLTPVEVVRLQDDLTELDGEIEAAGWVGDVLSGRLIERLEPVPVPDGLQTTLRPYQQRGLDWLGFCAKLGIGACLADDMGLGKTVQVLALLLAARQAGETGPTLLVAPMSVVGNWQRETARFAPDLQVHVHHGSQRAQGDGLAKAAGTADLVITTYGLVVRDAASLQSVRWRRLVLDEAQYVKNPEAQQTRILATIEAGQRIALTGTPVENRLDELWSIMRLLNPGLLGSRQGFQTRFAKPIENGGDAAALAHLKRLTGPFVLRRLKSDPTVIRDLPEKQEIKTYCNLTPEQASLYQAIVDDLLGGLEALAPMARRGAILAAMTRLKQLCNHPALYLGDGSALAGRSGKLQVLEDAPTDILGAGDRALIFTQFAEMGHLLQPYLQQTFGVSLPFLHGGTTRARRDGMVTAFQAGDGPPVMLLSLKAGGTGLNLTAANHVIHYDRWWDPAVETQATDRAYRIGQVRMVQVRPLICVGTLEEKIDQMLERKRDLADRVVGTGESWLTEMSTDQLREVLVLSRDAMMEA